MEYFKKCWTEIGSGIAPLKNEDRETHVKRVCLELHSAIINNNKCVSCGSHAAEMCGKCVSDIAQETANQAIDGINGF